MTAREENQHEQEHPEHSAHGAPPHMELAILNAGSMAGWLLPMVLVDRLSMYNMLMPSIFTAGTVFFDMFGATMSTGVIVIGLIFGFMSGTHMCASLPLTLCNADLRHRYVIDPGAAHDVVYGPQRAWVHLLSSPLVADFDIATHSVHIGFTFSVIHVVMLMGMPTSGALLGMLGPVCRKVHAERCVLSEGWLGGRIGGGARRQQVWAGVGGIEWADKSNKFIPGAPPPLAALSHLHACTDTLAL
ncbi:hypothetical protein A0H81_00231 [Grifola frondosa]|uniref:Uncharacterized protein n=1 Tax=Grifola frondosa TaxID=5627 RepID=A0A1C7MP02_GRIFR|nr:hypothetical protein A0H81_00231 [Grifola frondosa]